jgi:hypothetical protein
MKDLNLYKNPQFLNLEQILQKYCEISYSKDKIKKGDIELLIKELLNLTFSKIELNHSLMIHMKNTMLFNLSHKYIQFLKETNESIKKEEAFEYMLPLNFTYPNLFKQIHLLWFNESLNNLISLKGLNFKN